MVEREPQRDASDIDGQTSRSTCAGAHESKQGQRPSFEIAEDLQAALCSFTKIANDLQTQHERIIPTECVPLSINLSKKNHDQQISPYGPCYRYGVLFKRWFDEAT